MEKTWSKNQQKIKTNQGSSMNVTNLQMEHGQRKQKQPTSQTKLKSLLTYDSLKRKIKRLSKQETKTVRIARFGMLECGKNFQGTMSKMCSVCCNIVDDEEHRLNICPKYNQHNYCENSDLVKFETIYSDNIDDIRLIISRIASVWNVKTGHGSMMTA